MTLIVTVDSRENVAFTKPLHDILGRLQLGERKLYNNLIIKYSQLSIGDIEIADGVNKIIIERKTYHDMSASIRDGRSHDQAIRLRSCEHPTYYLIEAGQFKWKDLEENIIMQAITNKRIRDGFDIIHTSGYEDSALHIARIVKCLADYGFNQINSKCTTLQYIKKKKPAGSSPLVRMLISIPRVTITMATNIAKQYPHASEVMLLFVRNDEFILSKISGIGKATSKKIHDAFFGTPNSL